MPYLTIEKSLCWKCTCSVDRKPRNPNRLHLSPDHSTAFKIWIRYACQIWASEGVARHSQKQTNSSVSQTPKHDSFTQTNHSHSEQALKSKTCDKTLPGESPVYFAVWDVLPTLSLGIWVPHKRASHTADHQSSLSVFVDVFVDGTYVSLRQRASIRDSSSGWVTSVTKWEGGTEKTLQGERMHGAALTLLEKWQQKHRVDVTTSMSWCFYVSWTLRWKMCDVIVEECTWRIYVFSFF